MNLKYNTYLLHDRELYRISNILEGGNIIIYNNFILPEVISTNQNIISNQYSIPSSTSSFDPYIPSSSNMNSINKNVLFNPPETLFQVDHPPIYKIKPISLAQKMDTSNIALNCEVENRMLHTGEFKCNNNQYIQLNTLPLIKQCSSKETEKNKEISIESVVLHPEINKSQHVAIDIVNNDCKMKNMFEKETDKEKEEAESEFDEFITKKHKCDKCCMMFLLREMFLYKENVCSTNKYYICLDCSLNISDGKKLWDWEDKPFASKKIVCWRCAKSKSYFRFQKENKYCDYCLLKKKWSRCHYRNKDSSDSFNSFIERNNDDFKFLEREIATVRCCMCKNSCDKRNVFAYGCSELINNRMQYVCLDCSLKVNDASLINDWESGLTSREGKLCSRCRKYKSRRRFRSGRIACDYCSLKRKRMYLLMKSE